jgi:predicted signal transduction protein with EAL and GGDEF domain
MSSAMDAYPDLVIELKRDGTILTHFGGADLKALRLPPEATGQALSAVYPPAVATTLKQLARRCIVSRDACQSHFVHLNSRYEARLSARSSDRALCIIRALSPTSESAGAFNRREFRQRLVDSIATASLSGRPLALALIHVEGLEEIRQLMDASVSEQVIATALRSLAEDSGTSAPVPWFVGLYADSEVAVVVNSDERDAVESRVSTVCDRLRMPAIIGDASFHLRPCAGVAILGQDATTEQSLIDNARIAAIESRRSQACAVSFFSDTMQLRALTRLDVALELRQAIANGEIGLRYRRRHDLASGRLVALVGYVQWDHPMRGALPPTEFLPIAAATGLSTALSRSILTRLQEDFQRLRVRMDAGVRLSYGALRHHVLDAAFFSDVDAMVNAQGLPAESLEIRISERSYVAKENRVWRHFTDRGVQVVVDEVGRKLSSIDRLARAPISALQLDRQCAADMATDPAAEAVGRAVLAVAQALRLTPITPGVDNEQQRRRLLALGWTQGSGDLFADAAVVAPVSAARKSSRHNG